MTLNGWIQIALFCAIVIALVKPLGRYMTRVFNGERTFLSPVLRPVEAVLYRAAGVDETPRAALAHLLDRDAPLQRRAASSSSTLLQRFQGGAAAQSAGMSAVPGALSFNTAVSFTTNTNWQNYGGESTMSYLIQMSALTHQNFVSAATGIALAVALIRGFARASGKTVGQFLGRSDALHALHAAADLHPYALFLVWQGVPQTLGPYVDATTLEGATQTIAVGPAASQIAIKLLGTNGGGFLNANSAHPYENPTAPLSNFVQMVSHPAARRALTNVFGRMVGRAAGLGDLRGHVVLFLAGVLVTYWAEGAGTPNLPRSASTGGNMEGKEVRFGIATSSLWAVITTAASNGSVNAMHDSFTPLGGMIPLINMQLGEIIFGGVGSGLYGMLLFVIIAVFVAGLMVGRTPEYLGKKIEAKEVKMAMLAILVLPLSILGFTAVATVMPSAWRPSSDPGPHGFSEILYLFTSQTGNNGSAFGGFTGNTLWYNIDRRPRDADRPLSGDHPGDGDRRLAGRQEDGAGLRRHLPDRPAACSSACSSA